MSVTNGGSRANAQRRILAIWFFHHMPCRVYLRNAPTNEQCQAALAFVTAAKAAITWLPIILHYLPHKKRARELQALNVTLDRPLTQLLQRAREGALMQTLVDHSGSSLRNVPAITGR